MEFKYHLIIGFLASVLIVYAFDLSFFSGSIIFLSSVLIDFDHYLWYSFSKKDFNPFNAVIWYNKNHPFWVKMTSKERKKYKKGIFIFHSLIVILILYLGSKFITVLLWVFIGFLIHLICDWIVLISLKEPIYQKMFPLYTLIKNRSKKVL